MEMSLQPQLNVRKLGISATFLVEFVNNLFPEGREAFEGLTTEDVCEQIIKPAAAAHQISLCELLESKKCAEVGEATLFVSHV
jgi:hypothetical protein